ncbi:Arylsulfatase [Cyclobacterium qasimii M12-11B]|uniref:Arylsulfatase n=1 Tax=Cyclobacterium qasimii M12-11B TaxID=641524 RepID=S7VDN9_9BACT|nr:Arylsulfatase [Cyclobacterium qasimii M12-11B]
MNKKPNVIIIYTDDQGTLDLNIYGAKDLYTPNMDNLAKKGVRFTQFYTAAPVCSPSRASLLSGRYPQRAGLVTNASSDNGGKSEMSGSQITIAETFQSAGYKTGHIGKWHVGYNPSSMPNQQGFDYSYGHMGGCIDNYSHYFYWHGPNRHDLWRNGEEVWEDGSYFPDRMVEEIEGFLESNQSDPFFLYWALNIPHYPLQGQEKWRNYYNDLPSPRKEYAALISTMDEKIGLVMEKLVELGLEENTIIVFQSDHGHSEEERTFFGGGYAGVYRGAKFSLFEGGIRIPAIISWPGKIPQNEVREQLSVNVDWFPTLLELCNIPKGDHKIDGKSMVEIIRSPTAPSPHDTFFWQCLGGNDPQWAVREGDWKLIHNPVGNHLSESEKTPDKLYLYNISTDPGESENKVKQYPDLVQNLQNQYKVWIDEVTMN